MVPLSLRCGAETALSLLATPCSGSFYDPGRPLIFRPHVGSGTFAAQVVLSFLAHGHPFYCTSSFGYIRQWDFCGPGRPLRLHYVMGTLRPRSFPYSSVLRLGFLLDFTLFGGAARALQARSFSVLALVLSFLRFSPRMLQQLQRHVFF